MLSKRSGRVLFAVVAGLMLAHAVAHAAPQEMFERVFGDAVRLDPAMHKQVTEDTPGKRHCVDRDGDGVPEEVWFIDTDSRHPEAKRPVLVRVIDEDGDLLNGDEPDYDSDLYVADWNADGVVNVVCDYIDLDGDNDVDEMVMYFAHGDGLKAWYGEDVGDDNLLWYDVAYAYDQTLCQWRTHFGGDELFCAFALNPGDAEWLPGWENPFTFYDHDGDGVTEEVIRIQGEGDVVKNLRYSFDANNDATWESPRDFDVSVTAHAPEGLTFPAVFGTTRTLRGIPTGRFLAYPAVAGWSRETEWAKRMLTWDEIDQNIDRDRGADTNERWEGVIAKGNDSFPQVGGPSGGPLNNRFELSTEPGRIALYYAPTDQRLHLRGARAMWLAVDADNDGTAEMGYTYLDSDNDGYIDTWQFDATGGAGPDDTWTRGDTLYTDLGYNWGQVNAFMRPVLDAAPAQLFGLTVRLREALGGEADADPVWTLLDSSFGVETIRPQFRREYLESNETMRFYFDILKDRLIVALKAAHADTAFWQGFDAARSAGDIDGMRALVEQAFGLTGSMPGFAAWREAKLAVFAGPRVAWAEDWVPPNIGWESEVAAYRAYWGLFDFFGKHQPALVLSGFAQGASYHVEQPWGMDTLHVGQTAGLGGLTLYVNGTPYPVYSPEGKGTIIWSKRLVSMDNDAVTVELLAENVGPEAAPYTVRYLCSALAGRRDSPIEVLIEGGAPDDTIELGIGMTRLLQETYALDTASGIMASWGFQEVAIGWIGLGVVFPAKRFLRATDTAVEHQVVVEAKCGEPVRYHIQGDWLRGRTFPRSPVLSNWVADLKRTASTAALE